jgi:hypothetical protein
LAANYITVEKGHSWPCPCPCSEQASNIGAAGYLLCNKEFMKLTGRIYYFYKGNRIHDNPGSEKLIIKYQGLYGVE